MIKTSHANEIMDNMVSILGFQKVAGDVVSEFKAKLAAAPTEAAVDALYAEYRGQLKWAPNQEDWEALIGARKNQLKIAKPAKDGQMTEYALACLAELADSLDAIGHTEIANAVDGMIRKIGSGRIYAEEYIRHVQQMLFDARADAEDRLKEIEDLQSNPDLSPEEERRLYKEWKRARDHFEAITFTAARLGVELSEMAE